MSQQPTHHFPSTTQELEASAVSVEDWAREFGQCEYMERDANASVPVEIQWILEVCRWHWDMSSSTQALDVPEYQHQEPGSTATPKGSLKMSTSSGSFKEYVHELLSGNADPQTPEAQALLSRLGFNWIKVSDGTNLVHLPRLKAHFEALSPDMQAFELRRVRQMLEWLL